jgi:hypothetical protein
VSAESSNLAPVKRRWPKLLTFPLPLIPLFNRGVSRARVVPAKFCERILRRILVAPMILAVLTGCSKSPTDSPQSSLAPAVGPRIITRKIESVFADQSKTIEGDFLLRNETTHDIRFLKVNYPCSCTKAELSRMEVPPGADATLHVVANLGQRKGPQKFISQVIVEGEELPWVCSLETTIYQRVAFEPSELNLGFVKPGQKAHFEVSLEMYTPAGEKFPSADIAVSEGTNVTVTARQEVVENLSGGLSKRLVPVEIDVTPQAELATNRTVVQAKVAGEAETITATLPITWTVAPIYELSPARVFFGDVRGRSEPIEIRVVLRWPVDRSVTIRRITSSSPAVTASVLPNSPAAVHSFRVVLDPKLVKESLDGAIIAVTDDDAQTKVRIPFAAFFKQ